MTHLSTHFDNIALLVTHYNRSRSLEALLNTFASLDCSFGEIIVSDDGSRPEHLDYVRSLEKSHGFRLISTPKNKGLANNINKGQDAVTLPYTLYVQEDFRPKPVFAQHLNDALGFITTDKSLDLVRFYAYFKYPFLKPYGKGFSEMVFKLWYPGYYKFFQYSDHPHLRHSSFLQKFGRYEEGINMDIAEYKMAISFLRKKGKGLFYDNHTDIFDQVNTATEASTASHRKEWKNGKSLPVRFLRLIYLQFKYVKFNFDLFFMRSAS
jgi:glycosyltransferase involved in cell wall biosynthesis